MHLSHDGNNGARSFRDLYRHLRLLEHSSVFKSAGYQLLAGGYSQTFQRDDAGQRKHNFAIRPNTDSWAVVALSKDVNDNDISRSPLVANRAWADRANAWSVVT